MISLRLTRYGVMYVKVIGDRVAHRFSGSDWLRHAVRPEAKQPPRLAYET